MLEPFPAPPRCRARYPWPTNIRVWSVMSTDTESSIDTLSNRSAVFKPRVNASLTSKGDQGLSEGPSLSPASAYKGGFGHVFLPGNKARQKSRRQRLITGQACPYSSRAGRVSGVSSGIVAFGMIPYFSSRRNEPSSSQLCTAFVAMIGYTKQFWYVKPGSLEAFQTRLGPS